LEEQQHSKWENIMITLLNQPIEKLKTRIKGHVVLSDDPNCDEIREIWNAMIDRKPTVIVQCAQADDVAHAIALQQFTELTTIT
jgi:outer membrane PBP1 activator LpoA protein